MDKKRIGWIAILLAGGLMLAMLYLQKKSDDDRAAADRAKISRAQANPAATSPAGPAATQTSAPAVANRSEWLQDQAGLGQQNSFTAGDLDPAKGFLFQVCFVRQGAAISSLRLTSIFATDDDKRAWQSADGNYPAYLAAVRASNGRLQGNYNLLNPVGNCRPYATRRIVVGVKDSNTPPAPILLDRLPWKHEATEPVTQPAGAVEVRFSATLYRDANYEKPTSPADYQPALKITKTYTLSKQDYSLKMRVAVQNLSTRPLVMYLDQLGPAGVPLEERYRDQDDRFLVCGTQKADGGTIDVKFRTHAELQGGKVPAGEPVNLGRSDDADPVLWAGESNKFFASMIYLQPVVAGRLAAPTWQADYYFLSEPESPTSNIHVPAIRIGSKPVPEGQFSRIPDLQLAAGGQVKEMTFDIFAGPKKRDMLSSESAQYYRPLYKQLDYLGTINFQSCFCASNWLTLGMMWLLQAISYLAFGNYGVAIMVLVILVRLVLHPLTKKSQVSMMKMQKLAPEMEKIKKKYADDKEAMQREMMKFYKTQGSAPLLGCLPMLLQMPIWISLWGSLNAAVELRHAAFLPVWITDLAAPDAIITWTHAIQLPLVGSMVGPITSFNFLPILLTIAMFFQTKLNPSMAQPSVAPTKEQQTQQKMMKYMMPGMMLLFFYNAASGLTLYIMTSTFAGVIEQVVIRRHIEAKQAAEAALTTTVRVPGKAPRDGRPKKAKGPFFFKKG